MSHHLLLLNTVRPPLRHATRSLLENPCDCSIDLGAEHVGLVAELGELLVEALQVTHKVDVLVLDYGGAGVSAGVEAPALFLDLRTGSDLAQAADVDVLAVGEVLLQQVAATVNGLNALPR